MKINQAYYTFQVMLESVVVNHGPSHCAIGACLPKKRSQALSLHGRKLEERKTEASRHGKPLEIDNVCSLSCESVSLYHEHSVVSRCFSQNFF